MSRLKKAYETIPQEFRDEYTFDQVLSYIFTAFPLLIKIKEWHALQPDSSEDSCRACGVILASRQVVIELGARNEQELDQKISGSREQIFAMENMPLENIIEELEKKSIEKNN